MGVDLAASAIIPGAVRASTDEQRTGYALGVAIVPTAQRRSHDVGFSAARRGHRHDIKGWRLWPRTTPLGPIAWKISPGLFRILLSARKNRRRALQSGAVEPTGV